MGLYDRDYMREPEKRPRRPGGRNGSSSFLGLDSGLVIGIVLIGIGLGALILKGFNHQSRQETHDPFRDLAQFDAYYHGGFVPVNVNEATREELLLLPMVSERIADGIIARRPFRLTEELLEVKGIGEMNIGIICRYLYGFEDQPEPLPVKPPGIPDA